jgi:hypothetical protein
VAHTCNPSYSGGRDQEDLGSKPFLKKERKEGRKERERKKERKRKKGLLEWLKV